MRFFSLLIFGLTTFSSLAQMPYFIELGDSLVRLESENYTSKNEVLFINIHENEVTSVNALRAFNVDEKYPFVWLNHNATRRVFFNCDTLVFSVDPNRIFSHEGIAATLAYDSISNRKAEKMAKSLAREILKYVHRAEWVISLHNNTPDNYSILSYLPGGDESANTKDIYINDSMDADDFIYTTDLSLFNQLKVQQINVILQDNEHCVNDGSLSVYCGMKAIPYANVEAEDGHLEEQTRLIRIIVDIIEGP